MEEGYYILKKQIDWSTLVYGFNIPVEKQTLFSEQSGLFLAIGEKQKIRIIIGEEIFEVFLTNIAFNREKWPTHKEMLQIRYTVNNPFARKLRSIFCNTYDYVSAEKQIQENKRCPIKMPEAINEYFVLSSTSFPDIFVMECFTNAEYKDLKENITKFSEEACETYFKSDENASIVKEEKFVKVRKIDRSICEHLKYLYDYRCQVTSEKVGEEYGSSVIEAHHIDYFTKSLNNDSSNIIIISPNFHRIIHKNNPVFDHKKLYFEFANGMVEKLKINKHL